MRKKLVLTTIIAILLFSLTPARIVVAQDIPATTGVDLDPTNLDFGLVNDSEVWLKSGTQLFYSLDAGKQWSRINPETNLVEPYMLVSFPESDLGFALYLTQTETTIELEMHKTTDQCESWSQIEGDLEMQLKQQFSQPFQLAYQRSHGLHSPRYNVILEITLNDPPRSLLSGSAA